MILYRFIAQCVHVHKNVRVTMKACSCTLCELPGMERAFKIAQINPRWQLPVINLTIVVFSGTRIEL